MRAAYVKNGAVCVSGGAVRVGTDAGPPPCVCGNADGPCVPAGPCCEPYGYGRCTPRGWTKVNGVWSGPPAAPIPAKIRASGRIHKRLQRLSGGVYTGIFREYQMPIDMDWSDARSRFPMNPTSADCPQWFGSVQRVDTIIPPTPFELLTCPLDQLPPQNSYTQLLSCLASVAPGTFPPNSFGDRAGTQASLVIELSSWDIVIKLDVLILRADRPGQPSFRLRSAKLTALTEGPFGVERDLLPFVNVVANNVGSCPSKMKVQVLKLPEEPVFPYLGASPDTGTDADAPTLPRIPGQPFPTDQPGVAGPGPAGPPGPQGTGGACEIVTGLYVEAEIDIELEGDPFVACQECGQTVSDCCTRRSVYPSDFLPVMGNAPPWLPQWEGVSIDWRMRSNRLTTGPGGTRTESTEYTVSGPVQWEPGCPRGGVNGTYAVRQLLNGQVLVDQSGPVRMVIEHFSGGFGADPRPLVRVQDLTGEAFVVEFRPAGGSAVPLASGLAFPDQRGASDLGQVMSAFANG